MSKSILIVDDQREVSILLESALADAGEVNITHLYNGKDAFAYLEEHHPDLVLLDLQLPDGVNGLEILDFIRNKSKDSKVVMITAFASVDTAVHAMKNGASDYLCKPFTISDIRNIIHQHLNQANSNQQQPSRVVSLEEVERKHIAAILQLNDGNRKKTAEDLGISLRTLYYKIKQYDLA